MVASGRKEGLNLLTVSCIEGVHWCVHLVCRLLHFESKRVLFPMTVCVCLRERELD